MTKAASHIIFLHGPSSSGKSTLAAALRAHADLPFWHISIDHLRDGNVLPMGRIASGDFAWRDLRGQVFDGFHGSLAAYATEGNNLIVEHILDTPGWADDLKTLLTPFDVFFVGIHCALPELRHREAARGNRPAGSAEQDFHSVHKGRIYDIEVNGQDDPTENAHRILEVWRSGTRISEFATGDRSCTP